MIWRGRDNSGQAAGPEPQGPPPTEASRSPAGYEAPARPPKGGPDQPTPAPQHSQQSVGSRVESVLDAAEKAAVSIREDAQVWARNYLEESKRNTDEAASARMAEISEITDSLVNRARAVAQQSDELIAAMDEAGRRVVGTAAPEQGNDFAAYADAPPQDPLPSLPPVNSPPPEPPDQGAPPEAFEFPSQAPPPAPPVPAHGPPPPPTPPTPPNPDAPAPAAAPPAPPPQQPTAPPLTHESPRPVGASSEGARLLAMQMAVAGSSKDEIAWRLREEFGIVDSSGILAEIGI